MSLTATATVTTSWAITPTGTPPTYLSTTLPSASFAPLICPPKSRTTRVYPDCPVVIRLAQVCFLPGVIQTNTDCSTWLAGDSCSDSAENLEQQQQNINTLLSCLEETCEVTWDVKELNETIREERVKVCEEERGWNGTLTDWSWNITDDEEDDLAPNEPEDKDEDKDEEKKDEKDEEKKDEKKEDKDSGVAGGWKKSGALVAVVFGAVLSAVAL